MLFPSADCAMYAADSKIDTKHESQYKDKITHTPGPHPQIPRNPYAPRTPNTLHTHAGPHPTPTQDPTPTQPLATTPHTQDSAPTHPRLHPTHPGSTSTHPGHYAQDPIPYILKEPWYENQICMARS
jgi:hypothetical protein